MDTHAEVTAISEKDHTRMGTPKLAPARNTLRGPSQQPRFTLGQFTSALKWKYTMKTFVIKGRTNNVLGLPAITALRLGVRVEMVEETIIIINKEYPMVFKGLGNPYKIILSEGATPSSVFTPRHVPIPLCPKVKTELERMETMGVIRKVEEPAPWCAAMVVAPKKDGAIRICVDLKPLKDNVLREVHPLPKADDILAQLTGAKVFSKLDANSAFWQIPLSEESQLLTTSSRLSADTASTNCRLGSRVRLNTSKRECPRSSPDWRESYA